MGTSDWMGRRHVRVGIGVLGLAVLAAGGLSCGFDDYGETAHAGEPMRTEQQELRVCGVNKYNGPQGADVSYYQGSFNWAAQKRAGMKFGIARISDGNGFIDPKFSYNWSELKRQGMIRGAYQFLRFNQNITNEANLVVQKVGRLGAGDLPVTADVEAFNGVSASTVASKLHTWLRIVEQGTGKKPMIYTSSGLWNPHVANHSSFSSYPLWAANYGPSCPSIADGWSHWKFWQYCDGQSAYCSNAAGFDRDVFNGSTSALQNFANASPGDVPVKVKWKGLGNPYTAEPSKSIADAMPGDTFKANILVTDKAHQVLVNVKLDYWIEQPWIHATNYKIYTDYPAKDQSTWKVNDANSNPGNPPKDSMGKHGTLLLNAMSPGETKRIEITMKADKGSIGFADHPDVRAWIHHIDNVYGEQTKWGQQPTNGNSFGHLLRDYAQLDVLTRDHWQFNSAYEKDREGWNNCSGGNLDQIKINTGVKCLAAHVAGDDPHFCGPDWTSVDANTYDQMVVRMRGHDGQHKVAVYWANDGDGFAESRVVRFEEAGDDDFHTYVIPIGQHDAWKNKVTKLRIDPIDGAGAPAADASGWYDVDKIFFQSSTSQKTTSPDDSFASDPPVSLLGGSNSGSGSVGSDAGAGGDAGFSDAGAGGDAGWSQGGDAGYSGDAGALNDAMLSRGGATDANVNEGCSATGTDGSPAGSAAMWLVVLGLGAVSVRRRRRG